MIPFYIPFQMPKLIEARDFFLRLPFKEESHKSCIHVVIHIIQWTFLQCGKGWKDTCEEKLIPNIRW